MNQWTDEQLTTFKMKGGQIKRIPPKYKAYPNKNMIIWNEKKLILKMMVAS